MRTRVGTRALALTPGWTRVKEIEVGSEAGDVAWAVHELHGDVGVVVTGHRSEDKNFFLALILI